VSDDRRDDGFDLFDYGDGNDVEGAEPLPSVPETEDDGDELFEEFTLDAPESDESSSGRFADFMRAMSTGEPSAPDQRIDVPDAEPPVAAKDGDAQPFEPESAEPESPEPGEAFDDGRSAVSTEPEPGRSRLEAFQDAFASSTEPVDAASEAIESMPSVDSGRDEVPELELATETDVPEEQSGGRFADFMGMMSADGPTEPAAEDAAELESPVEDGWDQVPELEPAAEVDVPEDEPRGRFADFMGAMSPAGSTEADAGDTVDEPDGDTGWETFTDEQYVQTTTQEYSGLAEELAMAAREPTEQSAVSAEIPGLDSGVVGLEDVAGEHAGAQLNVRTAADVGLRVLTGLGLLVIFGASLITPWAIGALATVVFMLAASEFSAVLIRNGYRPIVPLTLAGTVGLLVGTWIWGLIAIAVTATLALVVVGLLFGIAAPDRSSAVDASLTVLVAGWIGGLGAFVFPLLASDDYRWLVAGLVLAIVAMDVGQYFVGRRFGHRPLAPVISPKKTVEGLLGGAATTLVLSIAFAFLAPYDYPTAALLAVAAIVLGPLGDLSVSLVKRILDIKDMGTVLPGHGGILDRIDALLFMIPAAWVVFRAAGFLT